MAITYYLLPGMASCQMDPPSRSFLCSTRINIACQANVSRHHSHQLFVNSICCPARIRTLTCALVLIWLSPSQIGVVNNKCHFLILRTYHVWAQLHNYHRSAWSESYVMFEFTALVPIAILSVPLPSHLQVSILIIILSHPGLVPYGHWPPTNRGPKFCLHI